MAPGPQCPIPTPWWKRYVDDVISIVKKDEVNILFNHLNSVDSHIKFTMEAPGSDISIPFLDTKCSPNLDSTIDTSVFRRPTHTDYYLHWNSNHPISAKKQSSRPQCTELKMFVPPLKSWLWKWTTSMMSYSETTNHIEPSKSRKVNNNSYSKTQHQFRSQ